MRRLILCFLVLTLGSGLMAHPLKMTVGKLTLNPASKTLSLTINFFIDDFEAHILKLYPQPAFDFKSPSDVMQGAISNYVNQNLKIALDGEQIILKHGIIKKTEDNVCQLSFFNIPYKTINPAVISLTNKMLFEAYDTQSNIIHLQKEGGEKTILKFYRGNYHYQIRLKDLAIKN